MRNTKLVISDCDGTLVTPDKQLTRAALDAVAKLRAAGIGFTITSSRPPFGMRTLVAQLGISLPIGAFNGSTIVRPDFSPLHIRRIPRDAAQLALSKLTHDNVEIWLFTNEEWIVSDPTGRYVAHEQRTIETEPKVVSDFTPYLDHACKIVGASDDAELLAQRETELQRALGTTAHVGRSQSYYLDVTPPGQDKGSFVDAMATQLGISNQEIATLGDMRNDIAMFKRSGTSFAMGNAPDDVKKEASNVTATNTDDGFAKAIGVLLGT